LTSFAQGDLPGSRGHARSRFFPDREHRSSLGIATGILVLDGYPPFILAGCTAGNGFGGQKATWEVAFSPVPVPVFVAMTMAYVVRHTDRPSIGRNWLSKSCRTVSSKSASPG
jgi:hypothetical protein